MNPDALVEIRFRTPEEGGRKEPFLGGEYHCPLFVDGEAFDCRLYFGALKVTLGERYEVPIKFIAGTSALSKLTEGKKIVLWEGKEIADGKVVKLYATNL